MGPTEEEIVSDAVTSNHIRRARYILAAALIALALAASLGLARAAQPEEVHFKPATTSTVLQGTLTGWGMKEYSMRAGKGQTLTIQVMSRRINWLVVRLYPASQPEGDHDLLNSDNTGQFQWKGLLPADGEYVLRLFIRRVEARRGGSVGYRVRLAILPSQS